MIDVKNSSRSRTKLQPIARVDRSGLLPLAYAQQRLWVLAQLIDNAAYHVPLQWRLTGELDRCALMRALDRIVARHEVLRTTFGLVDGNPVQRIAKAEESGFHLVDHDLRGCSGQDSELKRIAAEEVSTLFDLQAGPLIRGRLIRVAENEHWLLITMHHLITDGWALGVLCDEIGALYGAFARGVADPLPELPIQYVDYVAWHRQWANAEVLGRQAEYWKETLAGIPEMLALPADHVRPPQQDYQGGYAEFSLDEPVTRALKRISREHRTTLYATLLAAWAAFAGRLSGQNDIVIGTPVSSRGRSEIEGLIGFFVNTLPIRVDLSGQPGFGELVDRVKERVLEARKSQDIPFDQIVEIVRPERSSAHGPIVQVMFAWLNASDGQLRLEGLEAQRQEVRNGMARFDWAITLREEGDRVAGGVDFAQSLFEASTVRRFLDSFRTLLQSVAVNQDQPVDQSPLLSEGERERLVNGWNATSADYPEHSCVHELFEAQVDRTPKSLAVACDGQELTYTELNRRANRLGHYLRRLGVGPDERVGICVERGFDMVVGILATLKAGGAFVPLDASYPGERLKYMVRNSAPKVLLTLPHLRPLFSGLEPATVVVEVNQTDAFRYEPESNLERLGLTERNLAYMIYTSGSTGTPKGVMIEHRGVCNLATAQIREFDVQPGSRVLQFASFSFDASVSEMVMALCRGASLHLAAPGELLVGEALVSAVEQNGITHATLPPVVLASIPEGRQLESLQTLVVAGEALGSELSNRWGRGRRLINAYGPTEATVCATTYECTADTTTDPPIGRPIANTRIYVLDGNGEPAPVGVAGELYIGGIGVARGYFQRPDTTAARFLPDPFTGEGARLYATGDLGRWRADGTIEFLGRRDEQVKIRGYRIELGEIEAALRSCAGVEEAVVIARQERLLAYYTSVTEIATEHLRAHLAAQLPEYMLPAAYLHLDQMPLTPNGKLDRQSLPEPQSDALRHTAAPRTPVEEILCGIFAQVLKVDTVGIADSFFELGGHSLLGTQVMSRVQQMLGAELPLRSLFERPTVAGLAAAIEEMQQGGTAVEPIERVDRSQPQPLSYAQERLWFVDQLEPGSAVYNVARAMWLQGELDREALERAMSELVRRHAVLRTRFVKENGEPRQVIGSEEERVELGVVVARGASAEELTRLIREEARRPFDLSEGKLMRARLIECGEQEQILQMTLHHIVSDAWSAAILTRDLSRLYEGYRRGEERELEPLETQYVDYAVWQRKWLAGEREEEQLGYWRQQLREMEALEMPLDHARPAVATHRGGVTRVELEGGLTKRLKELSRREGVTLFMVLLGGLQVLLSRYSGQKDVVVGTDIANRTRLETEGVVGFFVNQLVLRTDLSGDPGFREVLGRVRQVCLGAYAHQDLPFERLVEAMNPERTLSRTALFQVKLVMQNLPEAPQASYPKLEGMQTSAMGIATESAQYELLVNLQEVEGKLVGSCIYSRDVYEGATVERMMGHWRRLLEEAVGSPEKVAGELEVMGEEERRHVVDEWNDTAREFAGEQCVHELFEEEVERTPEAVAVAYAGGELKYGELNRRANQLAHYLRTVGVGPDERVGICVERGWEMVVAVLGVLKAGGAYVPLDPSYPSERLRYMLEDSQAPVLLTQEHLRDRLPVTWAQVICVDSDQEQVAGYSGENPESGVAPENLAYMIYTSGSTGTPKGVMIEHRGVCNLATAQIREFDVQPGSRVLQFASFSFDASVSEMVMALCRGASLHLAAPGELLVGEALVSAVEQNGITHATLPPVVLASIPEGRQLESLQTLVVAGEALASELSNRWGRGRRLINAYGPTEATVCATTYECAADTTTDPPIGRPIANTRIYVLDGNGEPAPVGVAGELYIGGIGVARGYFQRPDTTAARFLPDPFTGEGARLYATGDLGRWRADGTIEFLGRRDEQVKIRGYRIELGEIEAALRSCAGVEEAVVIARQERLLAYYTSVTEIATEHLRAHLAAQLPEYMLPAAYLHLDQMPLTPNGKLDRKSLPEPQSDPSREYEPPQGEVEMALAALWQELLEVERVGRHGNFFESGGHSLLAVRLISRVRENLKVDIAVRDLFERPSLAEFAQIVAAARRHELAPIARADRGRPLPLSFAQQRLWFLAQLGGTEAYHIPLRLRLQGPLNRPALRQALDRVVARHEVLRTTFALVDGAAVQHVAPAKESRFSWTEQDLSGHTTAEIELERIAAEEASAAFDLEAGPLIRGRLICLADDVHALLITMHHIVSDGWSMGILSNELTALYDAFSRGEADPLPDFAVQYADYAVWQRQWMDGENLQQQADYWRRTLAGGTESLQLPADHTRPAAQDHTGRFTEFALDDGLTSKLKHLSLRHGTTLFTVLMAGWAAVLARLSGQDDIVVGTPVANRGRREIEGLIGLFLNTLAIRVDLSGRPSVAELIERVKERMLEAQEAQDIPFEQVVEIVNPGRSLSHTPIFQVMLGWQNASRLSLSLRGLEVRPLWPSRSEFARFDLAMPLQEDHGRVVGGVEYATALFEEATVRRYLAYFRSVLEGMANDEEQAVEDLPLLSSPEREHLLNACNQTAVEFPRHQCIHQLFEQQVKQTPSAMAVVFEEQGLTYEELNRGANRLAHYLRAVGVGPEQRVAVCLERGLEMVVTLLAVFKAGGVYVPLDPAYPSGRLQYMIEDSRPLVILTQNHLKSLFAEACATTLVADQAGEHVWDSCPETNPDGSLVDLTPGNVAYLIYTSGSTGAPKGVMVEHRELVNTLMYMRQSLGVSGEDVMVAAASFAFDISLLELMTPWLAGGSGVVLSRMEVVDVEGLLERLKGVTILHTVPSLMRQILAAREKGGRHPEELRTILIGGEAVPGDLLRGMQEAFPASEIRVLYGPTEGTIICAQREVKAGEEVHWPIGRPIANARIYLLEGNGELAPVGVSGELHIGGAGVARGYFERADMTAGKFVPDPFSTDPGGRLYATGDLARWRTDGNIEYVGRNDEQVKIRGYRIELGEIESTLREYAGVTDAVVVAREEEGGGKRLVAYYTASGEEIGTQQLREHVAGKLPEYMGPAAYVRLEEMPLTPNGKLDRKALPAPAVESQATREYEAPQGEIETTLAGMWEQLLQVERVGRHDHFFELGGHSLLAMLLVSRVQAVLHSEIAIRELFAQPTLSEFARLVAGAKRQQTPPILPAARNGSLPLSYAQQRLWFIARTGASEIYHIPFRLHLTGNLNRPALRRALDRIVARHEVLRSTFTLTDDVPVQRITPVHESRFELFDEDLSRHANPARDLERIAAEEFSAPFDLESGPLFRGRLVQLADQEHALLITIHHIVADGWSMRVMSNELGILYGAFSRGEADPLPNLPTQYVDYAVWQRAQMQGPLLERQAEYWKSALSGIPELLELPADHARPLEQDYRGAFAEFSLSESITSRLRQLARDHGTTLYTVLLAAWAALLGRLAGQSDVVVGTPVANRTRQEVEGLIGFFVNTLPIRVDLSGGPSVLDLVERVKEQALRAQEEQDIPFEQIVEAVQPRRSLSHSPLFQVTFTWQTMPQGVLTLPGLAWKPLPAAHGTAKVDLSLYLGEAEGRVSGGLEYATSLLGRPTVDRYLNYFRTLLEGMAAQPERLVDQLLLLHDAERHQLVHEWNSTGMDYPRERCVHELFEEQVARRPGAPAVVFQDRKVSYGELNRRANQLAHYLRELGVGPDERVGICLDRGVEMIVAVLAVLKAGGAYVPLDPDYPASRMEYMLEDAQVPVLLTLGEFRERLPVTWAQVLSLDSDWDQVSQSSVDNPESRSGPDNLAYMIYTSGSTGLPKGVMVEHRGLCNLACAQIRGFGVEAESRVLQFASFSFDASVSEIMMALCRGAALHFTEPGDPRLGAPLAQTIIENQITHATIPPAALATIPDDAGLNCIATLVSAGEALAGTLATQWARGRQLINAYGPTEATVCATMHDCSGGTFGRTAPIGRPIANTRIYILDRWGEPVPVGVAGQVYISGTGVARGYFQRPEMTADKFVPDPFADRPGARMFATGDLARWSMDGTAEFLGRDDDQVKLHGYRIELGEIESALRGHPGVKEAAAAVSRRENGERRLVAYYTPAAGGESSPEGLRAYLDGKLPAYMLPAAYVRLERMPLTLNGKLDRRSLPEPDGNAYASRAYEPPQGDLEKALAAIWQDVLEIERVGRLDNFFELGGHSLLAVILIEKMRQQGLQADIRSLFTTPTLAGLAALVTGANDSSVEVPQNGIPVDAEVILPGMLPLVSLSRDEIDAVVNSQPGGASNIQDIYPLAPLQEGILFHHLMSAEGDPYLLANLFSFDREERLRKYLDGMQAAVDRHDILRTAVMWESLPEPVQVVLRKAELPVEEIDLDPADGDISVQFYDRFDPRHFRMDVRRAPMLRVYIARDEPNGRWLMVQLLHHLLGDHSTTEMLREEIQAHLLGRAGELPAPQPFRNLVAQATLGVSPQAHERYFRDLLGDIEDTTAPFGLIDVQGDGSGIDELRVMLGSELSVRIRERARKLGVSAASLWHVAWGQVLARLTGRDDVVFGTVLLGRMQAGAAADRVMGIFINTLPVRTRLAGDGAETAVRRMHEQLAELMLHEHASLAVAQRCSAVPAPAPLFTTLLNYRHSPGAAAPPSPEVRRAWEGIQWLRGEERTNYPLLMSVEDLGEEFGLTAQSQAPADPRRLCGYARRAMEALIDVLENEPGKDLRSLSVLPEEECNQLIWEWNQTTAAFPRTKCVHELVEEQVERTPQACSLVCDGQQLNYRELNRRANQLARYLKELGVGPDERVGICLERSCEMVVSLLAVLKAGGAYVPLDPGYPSDRLTYMVEDSAPRVLLTQGNLQHVLRSDDRMKVVDVAAHAPRWENYPGTNLSRAETGVDADNLAYIIYTSGSTGTPKGVMNQHRGVTNRLIWTQKAFCLNGQDAVLQKTPFGFDVSVWEFFWPLLAGAKLVMARPEGHKDPAYLRETIARHGITTIHFVPSMLHTFLETDGGPEDTRLVRVLCSGEALPPALLGRFHAQFPNTALHNLYGPTEAAVDVTSWTSDRAQSQCVPIGSPIANIRIYILDRHGELTPVGVPGELHIAGVGVARGYRNRPHLTAAKFVPEPFAGAEGQRMYCTGDIARWLPDGTIEFLGRNDGQVKIRGFRIELGEIEETLGKCPEVREAVVVAREEREQEKRLVAYFTCRRDNDDAEAPGPERLRDYLSSKLPEYMVPAAYVRLEQMPLTPNGKLDRKELPAPETDAYSTQGYEPPRGEIEVALAEMWEELLRVGRVGREDNFFQLGGHSLLVVSLIERMRRRGLQADVRSVFAARTLAGLAKVVRGGDTPVAVPENCIPAECRGITPEMLPLVKLTQQEIDAAIDGQPGGSRSIQDIYPLSPLQEGIFFHHVMGGDGDPYLTAMLLSFDSRTLLDEYLRGIQMVLDRHDILRTAVVWKGLPEPVQVVLRSVVLPVEEIALDPAAGDIGRQLYARFDPRHYRIDVSRAPLLRAYIAWDEPNARWLMMQLLHHLAGDHSTVELMQEELQAHLLGQAGALPQPQPFRNLVAQARLGISGEEHEQYFCKLLEHVDESTAPFGLLNVQGDGTGIAEKRVDLDIVLARRVRERARKLGVSAASLWHVAWGHLLARTSGRDDVVFGTVLFGRMQGGAGAGQAMGLFINTLPVRMSAGEYGAEESVHSMHAQLAELLRHEHASLALAQRCSSVAAPAPLFSAILNYRHRPRELRTSSPEAERAWHGFKVLRAEQRTNYPFVMSVEDKGDGFGMTVQTVTSIDPARVAGYVSTAIESLVEALETEPRKPAAALDILPAEERRQLLYEWNGAVTENAVERCIHEFFEEQVRASPQREAVVFNDSGITYGELNRRANQLAHYLIQCGVVPDQRVGLCVERGVDMVVGLLGIMKAGGAYVPMDPMHPSERLSFMVDDARIQVLLTQSHLLRRFTTNARIVLLDRHQAEFECCATTNLKTNVGPGNLLYTIYTSGSTGRPNGVDIEHRQMAHYIAAINRTVGIQDGETFSLISTIAADLGNTVLYPSLCTGGRLHIIPSEHFLDGQAVSPTSAQSPVDCTKLTPSHLQALWNNGQTSHLIPLHRIILGGEAWTWDWVDKIHQARPACQVWNHYGPTECTVGTTVFLTGNELPRDPAASVPLGSPLPGVKAYVLDRELCPVPVGAPGELYIGGSGVARGYVDRPALTAERFLPDPFGDVDGARMYRSGDRVKWNPDGQLEFLGRVDDQVKIRGYRVELGEIERRLRQFDGVRQAAVVVREDSPGDRRLVAYYSESNPALHLVSAEKLRAYLSSFLPEYMVPAAYVRMGSMPLIANGKLDRKKLPPPDSEAWGSRAYEAPRGETERVLAEIWAGLLKVDRVGRQDNFFALGGHSLLIVALVERMRRRDLHADARALFAAPTLEALAAVTISRADTLSVPPNRIPVCDGCVDPAVTAAPAELRI